MTSNKTNKEIKTILDKHLSKEKQLSLFNELKDVEGNKSFKDSIRALLTIIQK